MRNPQSWLVSSVTALWHQVLTRRVATPLFVPPFSFACVRQVESWRAHPCCACPLCMIRWPFRWSQCGKPDWLSGWSASDYAVFWKGLLSFQLLPGYQLVYLSWKSHNWPVFSFESFFRIGGVKKNREKRVKGRQLNTLLMSGSVLVMTCIPFYSKQQQC